MKTRGFHPTGIAGVGHDLAQVGEGLDGLGRCRFPPRSEEGVLPPVGEGLLPTEDQALQPLAPRQPIDPDPDLVAAGGDVDRASPELEGRQTGDDELPGCGRDVCSECGTD